ncbi:MAG: NADH-quinone oxidoreductase subunit L [Pseudomonadota bacterium]
MLIKIFTLITILAPLFGGVIAGIFGKQIGKRAAHIVTIGLLAISFISAIVLFKTILLNETPSQSFQLYQWAIAGKYHFNIGLLIDNLTVAMMLVVTFVSLFVHVYSIAYMKGDNGDQRFFSYMSLFTFAMLCLVAANDFILLFFGWEGVGLVSYLLIGFWYERESAVLGGLKAFIVNRVGDMGFLLAIACSVVYFGSADYADVFSQAAAKSHELIQIAPGVMCSLMTVMSILLFIGAAGKSAQVPLHVWLPESMEGPTPISALIHAATMVTAGVYMLCRMSPILQYSTTALSIILVLGAVTALSMGLIGIVQNDIKRVIAYSTLSQLGYMMMGVGSTAYAAGMFHLFTHACFKALLFLAAGSVILGMHHEQDMRRMGGLWKYMPITWITFLIGALALVAIPPFSGFYSKDTIIEAIHTSLVPGASFAYVCALIGAFVTAIYTFRAFFLTFHGKCRFDVAHHPVHESSWFALLPLIVLAIPSIFLGMIIMGVEPAFAMTIESVKTLPFWITIAGVICTIYCYLIQPQAPIYVKRYFGIFNKVLVEKYGFDAFNQIVFVNGTQKLGRFAYQIIDMQWIDRIGVNGFARSWIRLSGLLRGLQSGFVGRYAFGMVCGLFALIVVIFCS